MSAVLTLLLEANLVVVPRLLLFTECVIMETLRPFPEWRPLWIPLLGSLPRNSVILEFLMS